MIDNKDIIYAKKLKELRVQKGYMQKVMAGMIGSSQQEYSKLETGNKHFTEETIRRICSIFKISAEEFTVKDEARKKADPGATDEELRSVLMMKLVNTFDEKPQLNDIVQLFKTKYMLEGQLKLIAQLLQEKAK